MDNIATNLGDMVNLMTALGFTNARAISAQFNNKPIVGAAGTWNGSDFELTFYVDEHVDLMIARLERAIRNHHQKHGQARGRSQA